MKVVISIFCLPYEIDDLENTLTQLKKASYYIDKKIDWCLDVTMCLADDMVDWKKSSMPKVVYLREDSLQKNIEKQITLFGQIVI